MAVQWRARKLGHTSLKQSHVSGAVSLKACRPMHKGLLRVALCRETISEGLNMAAFGAFVLFQRHAPLAVL